MVTIEKRLTGERLYVESSGKLFELTIIDPIMRTVTVDCSVPSIPRLTMGVLLDDPQIGEPCRLGFKNGEYQLQKVTSILVKGKEWEYQLC
jgi:hypothetical protein